MNAKLDGRYACYVSNKVMHPNIFFADRMRRKLHYLNIRSSIFKIGKKKIRLRQPILNWLF